VKVTPFISCTLWGTLNANSDTCLDLLSKPNHSTHASSRDALIIILMVMLCLALAVIAVGLFRRRRESRCSMQCDHESAPVAAPRYMRGSTPNARSNGIQPFLASLPAAITRTEARDRVLRSKGSNLSDAQSSPVEPSSPTTPTFSEFRCVCAASDPHQLCVDDAQHVGTSSEHLFPVDIPPPAYVECAVCETNQCSTCSSTRSC
jgi:hypothetical protein